MRFIFSLSFFLTLSILNLSAQSQEGYEIARDMLRISNDINTLLFDMSKTERIGEEYFSESFKTKLSYDPFLVYSQKIEEGKRPELLYRHGENDNKTLINPDGFPWFNISLDPKGDFMRKNQHHTLYQTGYKYALSILIHLFDKYDEEVVNMTIMHESKIVKEKDCYIIEFDNYRYELIQYEIKEDENILDIAKRYFISEYFIVELNEDVNDYEDVRIGQIITIPNDYCPRMVMAIEKERMIPLSIKVYDEEGLFEQLEYDNIIVDPEIPSEEFTENFSDYGF